LRSAAAASSRATLRAWQSLRSQALGDARPCGHEYTQSNAKFALTIEPENAALVKRAKEVDQLRAAGKPTLTTNIGIELETNPFLRPSVPAIQQRLGMVGKPEWQIFGEIRERKNRFPPSGRPPSPPWERERHGIPHEFKFLSQ
jgi:hydroxyacylglutathione hydrolase